MDYEQFILEFEALTGIKLNLYKEKQMHRRISTLIERKGLWGYEEFLNLLKRDSGELENFKRYITINVTEFFRTPQDWKRFEEEVLPELIEKNSGKIKVWSCACATGEEPYSLAISLAEKVGTDRFEILATDLNTEVLQKAQTGLFKEISMKTVPADIRKKYFTETENGSLINENIKKTVEFRYFDLLRDEYPMSFDLIVCRNVLIYFTDKAKEKMYRTFLECLDLGGYLFTGNTEQIVYFKKFGYRKISNFLYQKTQ